MAGQANDGEAKESCENNLPNNIRLTATLFINLRTPPGIYVFTSLLAAFLQRIRK